MIIMVLSGSGNLPQMIGLLSEQIRSLTHHSHNGVESSNYDNEI
jgi:hypothetical protein